MKSLPADLFKDFTLWLKVGGHWARMVSTHLNRWTLLKFKENSLMQIMSKVQIAAALAATLGLTMHCAQAADDASGTTAAQEKPAPSHISKGKTKAASKSTSKSTSTKDKTGSCKGKEGSCKGKEGSCKGKEGSCKGKESSCKGKEGSCMGKDAK
jgi:hypothetical protein